MSNAYRPRTGSLAEQVINHLRANPGAELTSKDIATKFNASRNSVFANLETAVHRGALTMTRNDDLEYVYRAGGGRSSHPAPVAPVWPPIPGKATTPSDTSEAASSDTGTAPTVKSQRGTAQAQVSVTAAEIEALEVETGIPIGTQGRTVDKWAPLFNKLTTPGTSVRFPARWKSAVAAQATKRNRQAKAAGYGTEYKVRIISAEHARVWRIA